MTACPVVFSEPLWLRKPRQSHERAPAGARADGAVLAAKINREEVSLLD